MIRASAIQHIPGMDYGKELHSYCAILVNKGLQLAGLPPLPSNIATDASGYGVGVDPNSARRGDVAVMMNGHRPGELGGHVGVLTGNFHYDSQGNVTEEEVYSSNSLDKSGNVIPIPGTRWRKADYIRRAPLAMPAPAPATPTAGNDDSADTNHNVNININGAPPGTRASIAGTGPAKVSLKTNYAMQTV